jgi:hypothetical protein
MSIFALGCKQAVDVHIKSHPCTFRPAYEVGVTVPLKPVSGQWRVGWEQEVIISALKFASSREQIVTYLLTGVLLECVGDTLP